MSEIFISYDRRDRRLAERLASVLEERTLSVWWDRKLEVGELFDRGIQDQLAKARCVIVLWTRHSVASRWVKKEALFGLKRNKLIQVLLEDVIPPKRFRRIHAANLVGWEGSISSARYKEFLSLLESHIRPPDSRYYAPLENITTIRSSSTSFSGKHLVNCLNKASSERQYTFMERHGIVKMEDGGFAIAVYDWDGSRIVVDKAGWKLNL